jgi:PAS domain S-box-containing protein
MQCGLLLLFTIAPLSSRELQATSYSGWPALGFAIAFLLAAGRENLRPALAVLVLAATGALSYSYGVSLATALIGSVALVLPAWLTQHLLTERHDDVRLEEVDSAHYHAVTAASAGLCGVLSLVASAASGAMGPGQLMVSFLMSVLAALTAQLAVLPLLLRGSRRPPAAGPAELWAQRILTTVVVLGIFWPRTSLSIAFLVFPMLGWSAVRGTRRETHVQLFLVCVLAYVLTFHGRGPVAAGQRGVPEELTPALVYLFMGAACFMTVPLVLAVERLGTANAEATQAATTLERLLAAGTGAIFIATDAAGRITHFNAGAEHTLGYRREQVLGREPAMFHTADEVARHAHQLGVEPDHGAVVQEMVRTGERRDWEFVRSDGTTRMASLTMSEVRQSDGEVVAHLGTGEDITDRLRAQEALMTALDREHASVLRLEEVDHVKQELVSNVSHELRTPITSISGYAELLVDGSLGELTRQQTEAMHRIRRNTDRLGLLVEDLLTLSRAESGKLELDRTEVDLRTVAAEAFDLLEAVVRVRDLDVRRELPDEPVMVLGDAHALERVVINLVGNAIKFTQDGGTVVLSVSACDREALMTVRDTGLGIDEADKEQLFTRFFRASAATENAIQGTGLGLSIVHSLVSQHDGTVTVDSAPGAGTTVRVALPRCGSRRELASR